MTRRLWAAGIAMLLLGAAPPVASVDDLAWLAGEWTSDAGGRWTEEDWTRPRGGVMLGTSRSGRGAELREFEFLRIAVVDGAPAYIAQPGGGAPVTFPLVGHEAARATFENAAHDYPQRIAYARSGDTLTATIARIDGSKAHSWTYRRR
ncbi:hypothetical protein FHR22_003371 [Sphingopyxis panaciterrae]|uniref:DUF6265 family protein n=1 Tax=Sphingopyxis panaciterrae TaxID=363841 RepID=UPI00141E9BD2|nr:DUF6265 family protein [Sphingopyxis panaciterrae]NIJ38647.1 hypothetical protein [Sphingopyxis panaciterrae]